MKFKIKATYIATGKRVFASSRRFVNLEEAKDYAKYVVGNIRFKGFRYVNVR